MNNQHFHFDSLQATGNQVRLRNKLKAQSLMSLAVNFIDDLTLQKIQSVLENLSQEQLLRLKDFLKERRFIQGRPSDELKVLHKIAHYALHSIPGDAYLQGILNNYRQNLEYIDELKLETRHAQSDKELTSLIELIDRYNEMNLALFEDVNRYREKKYSEEVVYD